MGVILRVLSRCEDLKKGQFRNLFLDMEENIHIHYRDLRIELSRKEFEDIVNTFGKQSAELMAIIKNTNYQDGILPNANHEEKRIWTESRLENEVVYHPQRVSIEKCTDGYHIHLRNYKLLFDEEDFKIIVKAFREIDLNAPFAGTMAEVSELLDANHLHYKVGKDGHILVAHYHEPKIRSILSGIGMARTTSGAVHTYAKDGLTVHVEISKDRADFADRFEGVPRKLRPLTEVLLEKKDAPNPDWLNALKAKVLDTFSYINKSAQVPTISLDYKSWVYDELFDKVIFPFDPAIKPGNPKTAFREWSKFLTANNLHFVKPSKVPFQPDKQKALHGDIVAELLRIANSVPAIAKIYLMGSAVRGSMGFYKTPFIHSEWSKLGSDADILIEIDEAKGFQPPENWKYINVSNSNLCDIYHIGQMPFSDVLKHRKQYPNIDHFDHLLDAYVYIPSKGDAKKKDDFLKRFDAQVIFEREADNSAAKALEAVFSQPVGAVRRLDVATENEIYEAEIGGRTDILKVYKVSGNYSSARLADHALYEGRITQALIERGVPLAPIRPAKDGASVFDFLGSPAVVFEKLQGEEVRGTPYPVAEAAQAFARLHAAQLENPLGIETDFSFDSTFELWHKEFPRFERETQDDGELADRFASLHSTDKSLKKFYTDMIRRKGVHWVHNHGDVQPRNVIMKDGKAQLFDLQNAFYGPRLLDVAEGAVEFSWGFKNPDDNDFSRFDRFIEAYTQASPLNDDEAKSLPDAIRVVGLIKFVKEVRMIKGDTNKNNLRRRRAIDLADHLVRHYKK